MKQVTGRGVSDKTVRTMTDVLMFLTMCFLAGTGLLFQYRLVPGFMGGRGLTALGLSRHEWGGLHLWAAYFLLFLVLVHMVLNFAFIKNCIAAKKSWIVIGLGLAGLVIMFVFLLLPLKRTGEEAQGKDRGLRGEPAESHAAEGRR
jgi:intracellular septation protein A